MFIVLKRTYDDLVTTLKARDAQVAYLGEVTETLRAQNKENIEQMNASYKKLQDELLQAKLALQAKQSMTVIDLTREALGVVTNGELVADVEAELNGNAELFVEAEGVMRTKVFHLIAAVMALTFQDKIARYSQEQQRSDDLNRGAISGVEAFVGVMERIASRANNLRSEPELTPEERVKTIGSE